MKVKVTTLVFSFFLLAARQKFSSIHFWWQTRLSHQ